MSEGEDYLVFGQLHELSGGTVLALTHAAPAGGLPHFASIFGCADGDGHASGYEVEARGHFAGTLFAVDGRKLILTEMRTGTEGSHPSPAQASGKGTTGTALARPTSQKPAPLYSKLPAGAKVPPSIAKPAVDAGNTAAAPKADADETEAPQTPEKADQPPKTDLTVAPKVSDAAADGAGEGVPVPGTDMRILSKRGEEFPVSGPVPELEGVKRSELARKAEARKKVTGPVAKEVPAVPAVSSSGLRLGKESGADKQGAVGQNKVDETELW